MHNSIKHHGGWCLKQKNATTYISILPLKGYNINTEQYQTPETIYNEKMMILSIHIQYSNYNPTEVAHVEFQPNKPVITYLLSHKDSHALSFHFT